jgi:sec-independent protein translocase protein TatA
MMRSPWHWFVVILIVLLLFGAKRLPDLARSLGRSMRIIKAETRGLMDDDVQTKAEPKSGREPLAVSDDDVSIVDPVQRTRDN